MGCGHSTYSSTPISYCANSQSQGTTWPPPPPKRPVKRRKEEKHHERLSGLDDALVPETYINPPLNDESIQTTQNTHNIFDTKPPAPLTEPPQPCAEGRAHPVNRIRVNRICAVCEYERTGRLKALESSMEAVRFEPRRWKSKNQGHYVDPKRKSEGMGRAGRNWEGKNGAIGGVWGVGITVGEWWKGAGGVVR